MEILGSFSLSLGLCIGLGLLEVLLPFCLVTSSTCLVLLVNLLVLSKLLLVLR